MHCRMQHGLWLIRRRLAELISDLGPRGRSGQDMVEYALIVGFIAVACAALIPYAASNTMREIYNRIAGILTNSVNQS
jgi:Flp pilus assembly pilin Flp